MATIDPKTGLPITDVSNAAIPTSALSTPQTPIKVASVADQTPIYNAGITTGIGQTQEALNLAQKQADELAAENKYVESSNALSSLQSQVAGKASDQASAYSQTGGVNDLFKQLSQLNTQAQGLTREAQAIPIQIQQESAGLGRTDRGIAPLQTSQLRDNALKALSIAQQAAIAQGNYDVAKNLADQQIEAKYAGITAKIEAQKTNLQLVRDRLTDAQKKAADARLEVIKKQEQDRDERIASEKAINNMLIEASPVAPPDVLAKATEIKNKGGSAVQVAQALGKYGGDYLKNELLKEQINKTRAETYKIGITDAEKRGTIKVNGKELVKASPKEIQDLNDTQIGKNSITSLIDQAITSIQNNGTKVFWGTEAGTRGSLKTNLLLAMKNLEKTGALDAGTINVLSETIPNNEFFATEDAQIAALKTLRNTVTSKSDELINSYKGTTAEIDPRTKRIYATEDKQSNNLVVPSGVSSASASYAQSTMNMINNVNNQVNTQQSYGGYDTGIK